MTDVSTPTPADGAQWPGWAAAMTLGVWYLLTAAPGVLWFDTGEIALVAAQLGLGHPPGFPLYTVVAGWLAHLPGVDPLWTLNALSGVCAALCALPAHGLLMRAVTLSPMARCLVLISVGALSPLWDQGTRIEVYAPATLLSLTLLAAGAKVMDEGRTDGRSWFALGGLAGLLACINPIFAVAAALGVGLSAVPYLWKHRRLFSSTGWAALGGVVGLCPHLHLWYVSGRTDRFVWGELETRAGIWAYLSGQDYGHSRDEAGGAFVENLGNWLGWLALEGALVVVVLGLIGWGLSLWTRRRLGLWLVPTLAGGLFTFSYGTYYPEVPDYNGYLAPSLWLSAVGVAVLLGRLPVRAAVALAGGLVLVSGATGERPAWARDRADVSFPHSLARAHLDALPEGAIFIAASDHLVFPIMYAQQVTGHRTDVVFINAGFAASGWYWRQLWTQHPNLPRVELAAPSTGARLRRLARATHDRPVYVESVVLAGAMGIRPCPATYHFALGAHCRTTKDAPADFQALLARGWVEGGQQDRITARILYNLAHTRAEGFWALGDASGALEALRAGFPAATQPSFPVPSGLTVRPGTPLPRLPVLLGSESTNRAAGAWMLHHLRRGEANQWLGDIDGEDGLRSEEGSAQ